MKISIIYPKEQKQKMKTIRFLKQNDIEMGRVSVIIDIEQEVFQNIRKKLVKFGSKIEILNGD